MIKPITKRNSSRRQNTSLFTFIGLLLKCLTADLNSSPLCIVKSWFFCLHPSSTFFTAIEHFVRVNFTSLHIFNIPQVDAHVPSHLRLQVTNQSLIISRREFTQPMNIISCRDHHFVEFYQRRHEFISPLAFYL